jgi:hypothetical protein
MPVIFSAPVKRRRMNRRCGTVSLVTAFILISVLFGLTPLNFVQKLGGGCPLHPVKNTLKAHFCQNRFSAPEPRSELPVLLSVPEHLYPDAVSPFPAASGYELIRVDFSLKYPPLRC